MSVFPLTRPVVRVRPGGDTTDPFGNHVPGTPVEETVLVFAWWVGASAELTGSHVERVDSDASLISDVGAFAPADRVRLPGYGEFEVVGLAKNWDANPWFSPGRDVVELKAVTG